MGVSTADGNDTTRSGGTLSEADRATVAFQIGRAPRALLGVAVRCVYGLPAVTRQQAQDDSGRPFPTAYYLTCPHLVRQIDRMESDGGVRRFEALLSTSETVREATARAHQRHAAIDGRGALIAAAGDPSRVKCLHAHVAFALAAGDHPLGAEALREASPRWCDDARCMAALAGNDGRPSNASV